MMMVEIKGSGKDVLSDQQKNENTPLLLFHLKERC